MNTIPLHIHPKKRALLMLTGSFISFIGYILPWYSYSFLPPGNSFVVNGLTYHSFIVFHNGFQQADLDASSSPATALIIRGILGIIILMYIMGTITSATITFFPYTHTPSIIEWLQKGLHVIQAGMFLYGFFFGFYNGTKEIEIRQQFISIFGNGLAAQQASQYLTTHLEFGFYILVIGLIISSIGAFSRETPIDKITYSEAQLIRIEHNKRDFKLRAIALVVVILLCWGLKASGIYDVIPLLASVWSFIQSAIKMG